MNYTEGCAGRAYQQQGYAPSAQQVTSLIKKIWPMTMQSPIYIFF